MEYSKNRLRAGAGVLLAAGMLAVASSAGAVPADRTTADRAPSNDGGDSTVSGGHQHGGDDGHLPGSKANVQKVGQLELTGRFGDVVPGQIADLSIYKDHAYLNSWSEESCTRGGTYVADIRDPRRPKEVAFIPALDGNYHGEGAHVISASTGAFSGDLLAVNNETCKSVARGGGFDLYDVSNPASPKVLVQGAGDFGGEGQMSGPGTKANEYHSVFLWKDDGKVYLVASDNEELHDVDIFDVSDPRDPKPVGEYDMVAKFPQVQESPMPYGNLVLNHDMIVKEINGRDVLLDSYWDAGYLLIDVENPAKPTYIGDSDFGLTDPLVPGISPPEGNAHQAEFSYDNQYFLAADEDFNPYRADEFFLEDASGGNQLARPAAEVPGGISVAALDDQTLTGKVVYGGYGCPQDPNVDAEMPKAADYTDAELGLQPGDERILLLQRGPFGDPDEDYDGDRKIYDDDDGCFPGEKAAKAFDAGWDAIVIANRHPESGLATADEAFCGSGGEVHDKLMVTVCTTHTAFHELFDTAPRFESPYEPGDAPALGTVSTKRVRATSKFDGWGYAHLYRRQAGKVERVDSYAISEALDPAYAFGFGDLSIHEFAADPTQNLAYISYYSGGMRVVRFGPGGITEVGHFIDPQGNNFWGVETFVPGNNAAGTLKGQRLFAGSDRDHGLWLFRYTGG
jgi:hypothetical protein